MAELGLYVYGLVAEGALAAAPAMPGVDAAHPVELIGQGELCALVSRVSLEQFHEEPLRRRLEDMAWVERTARRHQQVLEAVLDQTTPIPMRLCTIYGDEDGLRAMLEREQQELSAALRELAGKLEWGVQVFAARQRPSGENKASADAPATASGTAYLQAQVSARRAGEQRQVDLETACDCLHAELCTTALAGRVGTPQRPEVSAREAPMLLNAFYLVPNEQRDRFLERVEQQRAKLAELLDLRVTGPWAPYNFVTVAIGGGR